MDHEASRYSIFLTTITQALAILGSRSAPLDPMEVDKTWRRKTVAVWFCRLRFSLVIYSFPVYHLPLMLAFPLGEDQRT